MTSRGRAILGCELILSARDGATRRRAAMTLVRQQRDGAPLNRLTIHLHESRDRLTRLGRIACGDGDGDQAKCRQQSQTPNNVLLNLLRFHWVIALR